MFNPDKPYNELPLLPPSNDAITKKVLEKAILANRALAELKGIAGVIPNQTIILNTLTLKEAKDSSEIENIFTTQDELYKAFSADGVSLNPSVKEILSYREALWQGFELIKKKRLITTREIVKIQEVLAENNAGIRSQPGTALKNGKTGETVYTPPFGKDIIEKKLKNLEEYINTDDDGTDPLIKMAIIHYQFEAIHPFYDGNGRTGRILNVLYLIHRELLDLPILYLSSFIIKNKSNYYTGLTNVRTKKAWEDWIIYMLNSVEDTAKDTTKTIKAIKALLDKTIEKVKEKLPKIYSRELVETLFHQPYIKISHLVERKIIARQQGSVYLKQLENIGILSSKKVGREIIYVNIELFKLLKEQ
jgi:Fic family protein